MIDNPLRVIHSSSTWLPLTETWLFNQVKYLPKEIVSFVVCDRTANLAQFCIPNLASLYDYSKLDYLFEKGMRKFYSEQYRNFLSRQIDLIDAPIVHSHFGDLGWLNLKVVQRKKIKHVVTFYGYDVNMLPVQNQQWLKRYQDLFSYSSLFLCEGPHMAYQLGKLGCPTEKIKVHHLGVELECLPYRPRVLRRGEALRVLIAATFREKKGVPYALEALAQLIPDFPVEITIIGDSTSEKRSALEKQRILDTIQKYKLTSKVQMLGFQSHSVMLREAYRHHIFISPSVTASDGDTEGGAPVSIIEMIASGMPVVSTAHCDIPEVLQYGIEDWLVPERDSAGLANKLRWLLGQIDGWNGFLDVGRKHIENEFQVEAQGQRLADLYQQIRVM